MVHLLKRYKQETCKLGMTVNTKDLINIQDYNFKSVKERSSFNLL